MESITVHVPHGNVAVIGCLFCGGFKEASIAKFRNVKHRITTRCTCGKFFNVNLNFRKFYRKEVSMPGEFMLLSSDVHEWAPMKVLDLSMGGFRMKMSFSPSVQPGNTLQVMFRLEGRKPSVINKKAVIRFVNGDILGCEFIDLALEEKDLGFFLFN